MSCSQEDSDSEDETEALGRGLQDMMNQMMTMKAPGGFWGVTGC